MSTARNTANDGAPLRVAVIIGSTREGRAGAAIAEWFADQIRRRDDYELDLVDLAEEPLPVVLPDSDTVPEPVASLGRRLAAADAFVIVTPEYNHGYPASLKNAIDWFYDEWSAKPVAFVSYAGRSQGLRSVEQLRQVFVEVHAMTTRDGVSIDLGRVDEHGRPTEAGIDGAAKLTLDGLAWWGRALREARTAHPYTA
ncbi:NAD(P)H-dependent FMN reductase [Lipingzhangella halophila]|uniref:NAD(P)H-dependent FMN reductase n=1 Tax=Lipingzhangella halophila TaxID=1783352 RepID=A0A7W7W1W7_9ACTN|nr:NAD(P)H-dependent oxidoreductase [Lipingzhangella halophila]MBB4930090.1 NAD(P)H-dependent FMN reductase [Lipingzhangella halophila]